MPLHFAFLVLGAACAQAGRVLAVPAVPGAHPLRALVSADGAVRLLAPEWAEINLATDPVGARYYVFNGLGTEWQWTARPAEYARVLGSSGLLRQSTRLLALGGAYVESLEGRCAEPGDWFLARCRAIIRTVATSARHRVVPQRAVRGPSEHDVAGGRWESAASIPILQAIAHVCITVCVL